MLRQQFRHLNTNLVKYMKRPVRVIGAAVDRAPVAHDIDANNHLSVNQDEPDQMQIDEPEVPIQNIARLSKCPKTLHDLWREYEFGLNGFKPAKDFTDSERGKDKYKYYRRNNFWKQVAEMIRAGDSADSAIDKFYEVYGGGKSVTQIIADKKNGGHHRLRVRAL